MYGGDAVAVGVVVVPRTMRILCSLALAVPAFTLLCFAFATTTQRLARHGLYSSPSYYRGLEAIVKVGSND